ncbi:M20 metallopeptidase family protein [Pseudothermotoga thermarum]|uniref:Amidohydrolase n=1 Tax=Pseudothermotoga thermarum DSM 5069 TaxID=688269 RepID=F7YX93_9THEM|nr:M20 family metallopeptidase [Pseudothermotoga thermarum]AEH51283.1 amidohydrolase [Pseudothermotoga thermarum DSM 5069]
MLSNETLALKDEVVELRRHFHMYPEIGFDLYKTSQFVADYLEKLGLEVKRNVAKTGVVAVLRGAKKGKTVLLRADMDALPLQELNEVPYRSKIDGAMHACGHDAHTAILLVAAKILKDHASEIQGNVVFVFQPSEEKFPPGGALPMIEEGVLDDPKVDYAFGIHVWNALECGKIGVRPGPMMACADEFKIVLVGKGGHGATPHVCNDPIVGACNLVMALQTIVSRRVDPLDSAVVTVGKVESGTAFNIIPEHAVMEGTVRALKEETRLLVKKEIQHLVKKIADAHHLKAEIDYKDGTPPLVNDEKMTQFVAKVAEKVVGKKNVVLVPPTMGGEDFSFFLQKVPGCFYLLGSANKKKGLDKPHHSPYFDIDEDCLPIGVEMHVQVVKNLLCKV